MRKLRGLGLAIVIGMSVSCSTEGDAPFPTENVGPPAVGPPDDPENPFTTHETPEDLGATCDMSRTIASDGHSLVVRDQTVLSRFALRRVVTQLLKSANRAEVDPLTFVQRMFDTENAESGAVFADGMHCDSAGNPAFVNAAAVDCPRAEGALARSAGIFTPGEPDYFAPIALVHRFDLIDNMLETCGEYRIVYGKASGATDPSNRVLVIFEGALENPTHTLAGCRAVAGMLSAWDTQPNADAIERFYFSGGDGLAPIVRAESFGFNRATCTYAGECGQIRVGQGMQEPFDLRQFRFQDDRTPFALVPVTVKSSPVPALFTEATPAGDFLRSAFVADADNLAKASLPAIATSLGDSHNAGESALSGAASPSYPAAVGATFLDQLQKRLDQMTLPDCPKDDPLTPEALVRRSAALSCAGCHAPERFLGDARSVGCGVTWPKSLGQTHIDENGNLSEALRTVYLPHRASVLSTYLQACDAKAIRENLIPAFGGPQWCFAAGTEITMADGSTKPIERVEVGDIVLSVDVDRDALTQDVVTQTFVHPDSDHLVLMNGSLLTTANHPFWSNGAWVRADELAAGDPLWNGKTVTSLESRAGTTTTYNFEVAVHHDYFAGGILVHNKK